MTTDFRSLCAELLKELALFVDSDGDSSYISDDEKEAQAHVKDARALIATARAALAEPEPPAAGEVAELVAWLRWHGTGGPGRIDGTPWTASQLTLAANLLERLAPQPVPEGPPLL